MISDSTMKKCGEAGKHIDSSYSYDFNAVVIDYELKNDIAASALSAKVHYAEPR